MKTLFAALAGALTLASCSTGIGSTPAGAGIPIDGSVLPLSEALSGSADYFATSNKAQNKLVYKCVTAQGIPWDNPPQQKYELTGPDYLYPLWPETEEHLKRDLQDLNEPPTKEENMAYPPAVLKAISGPENAPRLTVQLPGGDTKEYRTVGCQAEAQREILGGDDGRRDRAILISQLRELTATSMTTAMDSPEVVAAREKFNNCIAEKGLSTENSSSDNESAETRAQKMTTNFDCKQETELVTITRTAIQREQQKLIEKNQGLIAEANRSRTQINMKLQEILSSP